jgi:hypothetical protein
MGAQKRKRQEYSSAISLDRVRALSDGVIAIVLTLIIAALEGKYLRILLFHNEQCCHSEQSFHF